MGSAKNQAGMHGNPFLPFEVRIFTSTDTGLKKMGSSLLLTLINDLIESIESIEVGPQ
jgi:hypothetical protein